MKHFKRPEMTVSRRFSDFLGLHEKLVGRYQARGIVIPPPPEKSIVGMQAWTVNVMIGDTVELSRFVSLSNPVSIDLCCLMFAAANQSHFILSAAQYFHVTFNSNQPCDIYLALPLFAPDCSYGTLGVTLKQLGRMCTVRAYADAMHFWFHFAVGFKDSFARILSRILYIHIKVPYLFK